MVVKRGEKQHVIRDDERWNRDFLSRPRLGNPGRAYPWVAIKRGFLGCPDKLPCRARTARLNNELLQFLGSGSFRACEHTRLANLTLYHHTVESDCLHYPYLCFLDSL